MNPKLTAKQVETFRRWRVENPKGNVAAYARKLGVDPKTLYRVIGGKTWR